MTIIIQNATIVPMDENRIIRNRSIVIENSRIVEIGRKEEISIPQGAEVIEGEGRLVIPSLLNAHTHASMTLLRGYADDMDVQTWLTEKIWPLESKLTPEHIYIGSKLAAVESVLSGCTLLNSMYFHADQEAKAITEVGLRAYVGQVAFSWTKGNDKQELESLIDKLHRKEDDRIRVTVNPHATYTVDPEFLIEFRIMTDEINEKLDEDAQLLIHFHLAETFDEVEKIKEALVQWEKDGKVPKAVSLKNGILQYLDELGFLTSASNKESDVLGVHGVALNQNDLRIMAEQGVKLCHCPASNLKLGSGVPPLPDIMKKDIALGLGTDGAASNNSLDMLDAVRLAALIEKGYNRDPTLVSAYEAIKMATLGSARALNCQKDLGSLEEGKKADLTIINLKKPHLVPIYNEISHLAYCIKSTDVETVICNGDIVLHNGIMENIDVYKLFEEVEKTKGLSIGSIDGAFYGFIKYS
ncbi:MAG: amidohydrolase, partial [Promethearchaeota archaeon]